MTADHSPVVLIVEDELDLADLYAEWLSNEYDVRIAYTGEEALEKLDEDIRVVLLDRRLPDIHGDDILAEILSRDFTCKVAMVTAVQPSLDIIGMGFDGYLQKPVSKDDLHRITERLIYRGDYDEQMQEYLSLKDKQLLLIDEISSLELEDSIEYLDLLDEIEDLKAELDDSLDRMSDVESSLEEHWSALLRTPVDPEG